MDLRRDHQLTGDQRGDPVIWKSAITCAFSPPSVDLAPIFGEGKSRRLHTWGHDESGVHWIGVRTGTPLHIDPRYARYTHQLVVRCDGFELGGLACGSRRRLLTGDLFCLDTHSPHELVRASGVSAGAMYVAASLDSDEPMGASDVLPVLHRFVRRYG